VNTIKIRLWGLPADVSRTAARLRDAGLNVIEESHDYRDREGERVRRYLTVQVPGDSAPQGTTERDDDIPKEKM
jgi:hypothetical protein